MTLRIFAAAAVVAGALLPQSLTSQDLPEPIKVDVNVVNVLASVHDKKGALINSLRKEDFQLTEDGQSQSIKYFTKETDLPLTIGMLVDVSGSQANLIEIERRAASEFFRAVLRKKDVAFLISFGADSELLQDITGSPRLLQEGLDRLRLNAGVSYGGGGPVPTANTPRGTVLFDAVSLAATDRLQKEVGRKVIVLITDGGDQGSTFTIKRAIEDAQKADAVIYSIYYVDPSAYMGRRGGFGFGGDAGCESCLKQMSDETGGRVFKVDRSHTLQDAFNQLQDEMRSQYAIGWTPANDRRDGSYHKLDIKVADKTYKVQARKGYYAMPPQ
jgi:VWFA-related protein